MTLNLHYCPFAFILLIVGVLALGGCNRGPTQYVIAGEVTYQDQPVLDGQIFFADVKGNDPTAVGTIEDGRYKLRTVAGEKRVRITATKKTGKMLDGPMGVKCPERIDVIPAKYNTDSTLVRTVPPADKPTLDFRL